MATAVAEQARLETRGRLRPIDPARDLHAIANLIGDAFASDLDAQGRAALRELRWMARLWPLVWWWSQADPGFRESLSGFVWEAPSPTGKRWQVVGNVNLNPVPGNRQRYILCNIVVQEAHRGQGIGRRLTEAAMAEAQELGAKGVILQVHQDNLPALQLYTKLGFTEASGETEFRLEAPYPVLVVDAPGYRFCPWRWSDGPSVYRLVRLAVPAVEQWIRPVKEEKYQGRWSTRFEEWIAGVVSGYRTYRFTAFWDSELAAVMTVAVALRRGGHRFSLLVHPHHAGQVEAALISRALSMVSVLPPKPVLITVNKAHAAAFHVLRSYGFLEQRTLLTLWRDF
ncbi:MAG: GNAT family N-acetyltransferase [Anaerolineae bacterium]